MPNYLIEGSYTDEGTKGLVREGGQDVDRAAKTTVGYRVPGA
jgi:hypothetical protein